MRVTVCPKCKSINSIQVVEDVVKYFHYDAESMEYVEKEIGDSETVSIYCSECGSFFEKFLNPEDYVLEVDGEVVVGSALEELSEEELKEVLESLERLRS